jgi:hypothetical protein
MDKFSSKFKHLGVVNLPEFKGTRIMMMPIVLGDINSIPDFLADWNKAIENLFAMANCKDGIGYLTIDEKTVQPEKTHRREGKHVDGVFKGGFGGWGGGGGWGSVGNGMLTVASHAGCRAWSGEFIGRPGYDGECDHLSDQCDEGTLFEANNVYWVDGLCVHESVPQVARVDRQFVRLSMPSTAPWFDGYTVNPLGVLPTGEILPRRQFMDS